MWSPVGRKISKNDIISQCFEYLKVKSSFNKKKKSILGFTHSDYVIRAVFRLRQTAF